MERVPGRYAVCRLDSAAAVPEWAHGRSMLISITRSDRELSIVTDEALVPSAVKAERGFIAFRIAGTLPFGCVGILSRLTGALADAGVSVLAISTFETDYLLVREADSSRATAALRTVAVFASPGGAGG
jgi:hypothetical protein